MSETNKCNGSEVPFSLVSRYQATKMIRICVQKERDEALCKLDFMRSVVFQMVAELGDKHMISKMLMDTLKEVGLVGE